MNRAAGVAFPFLMLVASLGVSPAIALETTPVCPVCGYEFEMSASDRGDMPVEKSEVMIHIAENGDSRWVVRNRIENETTVERFRNYPGELDTRVSAALRDARGFDHEIRNVSARVVGDERIQIRFYVPNFAERRSGVLLSDYLYNDGRGRDMNADKITVVGPAGTVVSNDPTKAAVSGNRATWSDKHSTVRTHVALVEDDGFLSQLHTKYAIAGVVSSRVTSNFLSFVLVPTLIFGGILGTFQRTQPAISRSNRRRFAGVLVGSGLIVGALSTSFSWMGYFGSFVVGVSYIVTGIALLRRFDESSSLLPLVVPLLAVLVSWVSHVMIFDSPEGASVSAMFALPLGMAFPLGAATTTRRRFQMLLASCAAFALALSLSTDLTGVIFGAVILVYAFLAAILAGFTVPLFIAGRTPTDR
ncbi:hypothetical protein [Haladaptatus cibarius]|uniref:hypothetical protein n=1 Tax=Haladaptatus cibarius TaxID=453847 RepID=UPI00067852FC|nr:hypothetical protein [Haladaptatus cibarius]